MYSQPRQMAPHPSGHPSISVIVPVFNDCEMLARCLRAVSASDYGPFECLVVDDGSTEDIRQTAEAFGFRLISIPDGPRGPAHARNAGAAYASGDLLVFIDADVIITPSTLQSFAVAFATHPDIDAVFGSYDREPATPDFVSQFKNLFHHFVHQQAQEEAATFWSGCGSIRRTVFQASGGFDDQRYARPCIEDIELGYRLRATGRRILLNKDIQVKHLKRWTLRGMVRTDIFDRGVPWTVLILQSRRLPNDLNLDIMQRLSATLVYSMLLYVALLAFFYNILLLPLLAGLFLMVVGAMNWSDKGPMFSMSRRAALTCYGLIGVIASLATVLEATRILPPLALLFLAMLAGRWQTPMNVAARRVAFPVVLGTFGVCIALLLTAFPFVIVAPLLLAAMAVVAFNYRLYAFFAKHRGVTFALAALPMHLLYYSSTLIALAIGGIAYLTTGRGHRPHARAA